MAKNKTTETQNSVDDFINTLPDVKKREAAFRLVEIYKSLTGYEPKLWGPSIIGFGTYHYKYASGHEGDAPLAGFSPRKSAIVLYIGEFKEREQLLKQLGKYTRGKVCIYIKKLEDVDIDAMKKLIKECVKHTTAKYS